MNIVVISTYDVFSTTKGSNVYSNIFRNLNKSSACPVTYRIKKIPNILKVFSGLTRTIIKLFINPKTTYEATRSPVVFLYYLISSWLDSFSYGNDTIFITNTSALRLSPPGFKSFCIIDWTYDFYFQNIACRDPDTFEYIGICLERFSLVSFAGIFTLFDFSAQYLSDKNLNFSEITYIGNGINLHKQLRPILRDLNSFCIRLLFVGRLHYVQSLFKAIELASNLKSYSGIKLDVVGITEDEFMHFTSSRFEIPSGLDICFHGYLDISNMHHNSTYIDLLQRANFLVNLTPNWCSFQAILDALNFSLPIIIMSNKLIFSELSSISNFSYLISSRSSDSDIISVACQINNLSLPIYHQMCSSAFSCSLSFSWLQTASNIYELIHK